MPPLPLAVTNPSALFFNVNFIPSSSLPFSSVLIIFSPVFILVLFMLTRVSLFFISKSLLAVTIMYPSGASISSRTYLPKGRYSRVKVPFSPVTIAVASSFLSAKEAKLVPSTFTYFPSAFLIINSAPGSAVFPSSANFVTVSLVCLFSMGSSCITLSALSEPSIVTFIGAALTYPCGASTSVIVYSPNASPVNVTTPSRPLADFLVMPLPLISNSTPSSGFPSSPFLTSVSEYSFSVFFIVVSTSQSLFPPILKGRMVSSSA